MKKYDMRSKLQMNRFVRSFQSSIVPYNYLNMVDHHSENIFLGNIRGDRFYFFYKKAYITYSFTTVLRGNIKEDGADGCGMTWHFSKSYAVMAMGTVFLLFDFLLTVILSFQAIWFALIGLIIIVPIFSLLFVSSKKAKVRLTQKLNEIINAGF